jgi:glycosyltransferase involved in cell wall biosynthesis
VTSNSSVPMASSGRLKVAVLNRIFSPTGGGAERYSIALVEGLAHLHDIHVFAQEVNHNWPGVTYHKVSCFGKKPRWLNQLWYSYASWRATSKGFDIVHSHENVWHGNVQTMHVKTVKGSLFEGRSGLAKMMRWAKIVFSPRLISYLALEARRLSVHDGVAIVAVSQALEVELSVQYPACASKIHVITPGVSLPLVLQTKQEARKSLGLAQTGQFVLFVANDYARKGLASLLRALKAMPAASLIVVGHAGQIGRFKVTAEDLNIAHRVHFLGPLTNMALAYEAADVLAHPTLEDTFAMVVIEAMAHKLPVLVSDATYCGISSLLSDRCNAILIKNPHDSDLLKDELTKILGDPEMARQLSDAGYTFAAENTWNQICEQYENLYKSIV